MKARQERRRPTQFLDRKAFRAIEPVKIRPPDVARPGRGQAKIGKRDHHFHLPELIPVARISNRSFHFYGMLHVLRGEAPIALEGFGNASLIKVIRDDGVEDRSERIPLEFEVTVQLLWSQIGRASCRE